MSTPDYDRKRKYGPDAPPDVCGRPGDAQPPPPGPVTENINVAGSNKKSRVEEDEVRELTCSQNISRLDCVLVFPHRPARLDMCQASAVAK